MTRRADFGAVVFFAATFFTATFLVIAFFTISISLSENSRHTRVPLAIS
jgi:hypothetical protein